MCQPRFHMGRQSREQTDIFLLPLRREITPDPPARVRHTGTRGLRQRVKLQHAPPINGIQPSAIIQIQRLGRRGFIDRVHARFALHGNLARLVLILDHLPAAETRRGDLIIQRDRRLGQVIEQRLQPVMEEPKPMLGPLMFAPRAHRLVKRIVTTGRAELDAIILPEPGDGAFIKDHL